MNVKPHRYKNKSYSPSPYQTNKKKIQDPAVHCSQVTDLIGKITYKAQGKEQKAVASRKLAEVAILKSDKDFKPKLEEIKKGTTYL